MIAIMKLTLLRNTIVVALVSLLVGFGVGYLVYHRPVAKLASAQDIERAKREITALYKGKTVDACWLVNDGANLAAEKYELTYRNLRINNHANRAIISDCSDSDTLLAKNKAGDWVQTSVNLQIGNRVNPTWQKACGIEDITVADEVIRSENSTIDQENLKVCEHLDQL
jgi:hypothetical protein